MNVSFSTDSQNRTIMRITHGSDFVVFQEHRLVVRANGYTVTFGEQGSAISLDNTITLEDHAEKFITPLKNTNTGQATVVRQVRYTASFAGSTSWRDEDVMNVSYSFKNNDYTRPTLTMTLSPTAQLNGYNAVGITALQASFTGNARLGASISSYRLTVENKSYGSPYISDVLTSDGWVTVTGTVTDSRGFSSTVSERIWVISCMPSINLVSGSTRYLDGAISIGYTPPSDDAYSEIRIDTPCDGAYKTVATLRPGQASGPAKISYSFSPEELKEIYESYPNISTPAVRLRFTLISYMDNYVTRLKEEYAVESFLDIPENSDTKPKITNVHCVGVPRLFYTDDIFVKGKNGINVIATAEAKYGASIDYIHWTIEGESFPNGVVSDHFNNFGRLEIKVKAVDSRGFADVYSCYITVYDYVRPYVSAVDGGVKIIAARSDPEGNLSDSGDRLRIEAGKRYVSINGQNKCVLRYRLKTRGDGAWSDYSEILSSESTSDDFANVLNEIIDPQNIYFVELSVIDSFGEEDTVIIPIPTEKAFMDRSGTRRSIAFGGHVTKDDAFEVYWGAHFYGGVTIEPFDGVAGIVIGSSTEGSDKKFLLTVNDSGTLSVSEYKN